MNTSEQSTSTEYALEGRPSTQKNNLIARTRNRIERSTLLEKIEAVCSAVNQDAGATVIEVHAYLPPEHVMRSFTFVKNQIEYVMHLDLWGSKPALVFLVRKWRDTSSNSLVRWFWRTVQKDPLTVDIRLAAEIREEAVSEQEVQEWFGYLLSGLHRSYMPALKRSKGYGES